MIPRLLAPYLLRDAGHYPIVTLTGPRQSGKTTLCRAVFPDHDYRSLELPDQRRFAREDPRGFLAACRGPVILDEVQHVPELLSYLQVAVDEDPTPGRFVLTGSYHLLLRSQVSQTLAGRTALLNLLPLSRAELDRQDQPEPISPSALFANAETKRTLWPLLHTGGYPRIHDRAVPAGIWLPDYIQTYLERDVRSLAAVGDLAAFERFLALCAGRAAQLLNYSSLASDTGIAVDTARRWVSVLQATFVVFLLPPHHRNLNKRVVKTPKLFFHDTGLLCQLLGIRDPEQIATHPLRGALFENFVVSEVAKAYLHHRITPPLFFWRDRTGHEVDLLIDHGVALQPVEIKSTQTPVPELLDGLRWWMRAAGEAATAPILVHAGEESRIHAGIAIRPWFSV